MQSNIFLGKVGIGKGFPTRVIGELSCNHFGDLEIAKKSIHAMVDAGVDIVKIQTSRPDKITLNCNKKDFMIDTGTLWDNRTLFSLYSEIYTPWEWHAELFELARSLGVEIFSSPFDLGAVDFLEALNCPAYKIASFEITDIPLIEKAAKTMKPIIISTGIAEYADIKLAIDTCRAVGNDQIVILKCTSAYPAPIKETNLRTMVDIEKEFNVLVGISDHTMSDLVPISSISLGGKLIEKHFTLDRKMGGADSAFSLEPLEFSSMISKIRDVESLLGSVTYELSGKSKASRKYARSLYYIKELNVGDIVTEDAIQSVRPSLGLHPKHFKEVLNKTIKKKVGYGDPVQWSDF